MKKKVTNKNVMGPFSPVSLSQPIGNFEVKLDERNGEISDKGVAN